MGACSINSRSGRPTRTRGRRFSWTIRPHSTGSADHCFATRERLLLLRSLRFLSFSFYLLPFSLTAAGTSFAPAVPHELVPCLAWAPGIPRAHFAAAVQPLDHD